MPLQTASENSETKQYSSGKEKDVVSQEDGPVKTSKNVVLESNLGEEHSQTPPASDEIKELDEKKTDIQKNDADDAETENEDVDANVSKTENASNSKLKNDTKNEKQEIRRSKKFPANNRGMNKTVHRNKNPKERTRKTETGDSDLNDEDAKRKSTEQASNPGDDNEQELIDTSSVVSEKNEEDQPGPIDPREHTEKAATSKDLQTSKPKPGLKNRSKLSRSNFFDNAPIDGRVKRKTHPYERMTHMRGSAQKGGSTLQKQTPKSKMIEKTATEEEDDWAEQLFDDPYRMTPVQNGGLAEKNVDPNPNPQNQETINKTQPESKPVPAEQENPENQNEKADTVEEDNKKLEKQSAAQKPKLSSKPSLQKPNPQMRRGKRTSKMKPGKIGVEIPRSKVKTSSKATDNISSDAHNSSSILRASSSMSENTEKQKNAGQVKTEEESKTSEVKEEEPAEKELLVESVEDQSRENQSNLPEVRELEIPKTHTGGGKTPAVGPQRNKVGGSTTKRAIVSNSNPGKKEDLINRRRRNAHLAAVPPPSNGKPSQIGRNKPSEAQKSLDEAMEEVKDDEDLLELLPPVPDDNPSAQTDKKSKKKEGPGKLTRGKQIDSKLTPRISAVKVQEEAKISKDVDAGADDALQKAKDAENKPEEVSDTELPINLDGDNDQDNSCQKSSMKARDPQKRAQKGVAQVDSIDDLIDLSASMSGHLAVARKRKTSNSESFGGATNVPESEDGQTSTVLETGSNDGTDTLDGTTSTNKQGKKKYVKGDKEWLLNKGMAKPVPQSIKVSSTRVEKEVGKIRLDGEPNSDEELQKVESEEGAKANEDTETQEKDEEKPKLDAYGRPLRTKSAIMRAKEVIDSKEMSESTENLLKALCEDAIDELIRNAQSSYKDSRVDSGTDTIDVVANENREDPNKTVKRKKKKDEYIPARYTFATFRNCPCILCTRKKPRKMKILTKSKKRDKTVEEEPEPEVEPEPEPEVDPQRQLAEAAAKELLHSSEAHPINGQDPIEVNASGIVVQRIIEMSASLPTSQLLWRITDVKSKIQSAKKEVTVTIFSQAFYTAPHGYKLICATCPYGNKQGLLKSSTVG